MKKLLGLVILLAVLILGSYYGMGFLTERTIKRDVQVINQYQGLHIDVAHYNRGWFCSDAKFAWEIHVPQREMKGSNGQVEVIPAQDIKLDMPLKIHHGPIIFTKGVHFGLGYGATRLHLPNQYVERFNEMFTPDSTKPQLDISVLVNYLQQSTVGFDLPQFTLIAKKDNTKFEWLGMQKDVTISSNLSTVKGDFVIDGFRLSTDKNLITLGEVKSDYDLKKSPEGLYVGDAQISIPSLVVTEASKRVFESVNYKIKVATSVDSGLLDMAMDTSIDKVNLVDKSYGPGVLKISFKNLDAKVFAYINAQANTMQQGTEQEKQQAMMALLPELPKLFNKGAKFEISELKLTMPEGTFEGNVWVQLPKDETGNPFQMAQKIEGEGRVRIPIVVVQTMVLNSEKQQLKKPSLQQAMLDQMQKDQKPPAANAVTDTTDTSNQAEGAVDPAASANPVQALPALLTPEEIEAKAKVQMEQKLGVLEQSGLLRKQGNDYIVEAKLANGQLTVNGQPFNPSTMHF